MSEQALWSAPMYQETVGVVLLFIFTISASLYFLRNNNKFKGAWASTKSWLFAAPLLFAAFGLPSPWPLVFLVMVAIFGAKTFFRMTGMYHRSWFIVACYAFILALGWIIYDGTVTEAYNLMPMLFLGSLIMIPLIRNSSTHMIQYIALSLLAYIFFGWAFLHMGRILSLEKGVYMLMYLYILVEFSEAMSLFGSRMFGRTKMFSKISNRVTLEGGIFAMAATLVLAWAMRHMLPMRTEAYWISAGFIASFFGRSGDLFLSVIRRDLGIKERGIFIIGRDDILARIDKLIFTSPVFYYTIIILPSVLG